MYGANVVLEGETPMEAVPWRTIFRGKYLRSMFAVYTFGPTIMSALGLSEGRSAMIGEIVVGTFFLLGTIPAMFLAESMGRRPLLIWSFVAMTLALGALVVIPSSQIVWVAVCFSAYALFAGGPGNLALRDPGCSGGLSLAGVSGWV